ncbi:MAG: efflux transporter permease subunit [Caulobacter sp.]|nr:efflux transporter permease subunit [Caulobacter sp.]
MTVWLRGHVRSLGLAFILLTVAGLVAAVGMPVSLFPKIDFPRLVVSVDAGDRPADEMAAQVTRHLEQSLRGVPGVVNLRSTSSRGSAEVSVSFDWGTDMIAATLQAESAVNAVLPDLPPGARFEVRRMDPTIFPILGLALTSSNPDLVKLRDFAQLEMRPVIASVPGVANVDVLGGKEKEYQVLADPARLQALGLSIDDLAKILSANNVVVAAGRLEDRHRLYLVLAENRIGGLDDLKATIVKSGEAGIVPLSAVAEIKVADAPNWTRVTAQGRDAVLVNIRQAPGANSVALVKEVRARLKALAPQTPPGVKISTFYDQTELVTAAAASVRDAILIGAVLAGLVVFLFLRSWRVTLIIALLLPAVLASTAVLLSLLGMSFNMMTLGGMAAAVGLVVDDAVVMLEHVMRRLQERRRGEASGRSALDGAAEMLRPLMGSTFATVVIFLPLAFLSGVTGGFFKALAVTMSAALILSLLFALFVAPLLADRWLKDSDADAAEKTAKPLGRLADRYAGVLRRGLARPGLVALIVVAVMLATGGLAYTRVQTGFIPKMDEGGFVLDYKAPPGTSLTETDRLLRQAEAIIRATPEVDSYSRRTGLQLGGGLTEADEGDFFIHLKAKRGRGVEAVMTDIRTRIEAEVPGLELETVQLMEDLIGDLTAVPQPIEVKLFSGDPAALAAAAPQVQTALEGIKGLAEVQSGQRLAGDAVVITTDRPAAALDGLDPDAVTQQLQRLIGGEVIGQVREGEKQVGIRVWTPGTLRSRVEALSQLHIRAPDGHDVPLSRIAKVSVVQGQPQITRENLQPFTPVTARLDARDMGSAMTEVKQVVGKLALPSNVRVEYGGLYAEQQKSFRDLAVVFAAAVLLVALLLLYLFENLAAALAILTVVLTSASAVFVGLWLTGTELDISAMMGLTMVIGIVGELAIFYLAELDPSRRPVHDDLIEAGRARLRPILMSALIAILALSPLAFGIGRGSEMQKPLAIAIISGLIAGAPLVLLLLPLVHAAILGRLPPPRPQPAPLVPVPHLPVTE